MSSSRIDTPPRKGNSLNTRWPLLSLHVAALLLAGCDPVKAPKGVDPKPYLRVLTEGLTKEFDYHRKPQGVVTIMSGLSSAMEAGDFAQMRFSAQYLDHLRLAEKAGFVTLQEHQQDPLSAIANLGARYFTVTPTDKLRKLADPAESSDTVLAVPVGRMKILEVISEEACVLKRTTPGDEWRLVLGLVRDTPTEQALALGRQFCSVEEQTLKFRALLHFNPFGKTYRYVAADWGRPNDMGWKSENVARLIRDSSRGSASLAD